MSCEILPAHHFSLSDQAEAFTRAFAGYLVGSVELDAEGFARFISAQGVDLCHSYVAGNDNAIAGFALINRTGEFSRLAAMGVVPTARRTGLADRLVRKLLDQAKARDDRAMTLEVFEQNSAALPLYQRHGFRTMMRLFGWRRPSHPATTAIKDSLPEISLLEAASMTAPHDYPQWPWQISRHAMVKLINARAFRLQEGCVIISNLSPSLIRMHGFFSPEKTEAVWTQLRLTLAALLNQVPECEFFAPPIFPEDVGEKIFRPLEFVREPLNQFLMRVDF
jgi:ribosomal protein S18 acetylase RimI-like enzyme